MNNIKASESHSLHKLLPRKHNRDIGYHLRGKQDETYLFHNHTACRSNRSQDLFHVQIFLHMYFLFNHKNYNFLGFDSFKKGLFSTNSLAKLLSDSLLLDSLLLDSLLSDSSKSQSHSKM